jgi:short subunit dehydrogenase-like uncharacterized protein
VILADARDDRAVASFVRDAAVVVNLAAPYSAHGETLVRACARSGTDYVDATAETAHVRRLIDRYHETAAGTGARIVPCCGFDSVPADLGVLLVVDALRERGRRTREVRGFYRVVAGLNPGTIATSLELWRHPADMQAMQDPLLLNPPAHRSATERRRNPDPSQPLYEPHLGRWVSPFAMGLINTRVVRRSRALFADRGQDYGRGFRYQEYWDPGGPGSLLSAAAAAGVLALSRSLSFVPGAGSAVAPLAGALRRREHAETPGRGSFFRLLLLGIADDGLRIWATISARGDPSNDVTARILCEAALRLTEERAGGERRANGGVLTPATALGLPLLDRLRAVGFECECPAQPAVDVSASGPK